MLQALEYGLKQRRISFPMKPLQQSDVKEVMWQDWDYKAENHGEGHASWLTSGMTGRGQDGMQAIGCCGPSGCSHASCGWQELQHATEVAENDAIQLQHCHALKTCETWHFRVECTIVLLR